MPWPMKEQASIMPPDRTLEALLRDGETVGAVLDRTLFARAVGPRVDACTHCRQTISPHCEDQTPILAHHLGFAFHAGCLERLATGDRRTPIAGSPLAAAIKKVELSPFYGGS